jgi:hypothetical protein
MANYIDLLQTFTVTGGSTYNVTFSSLGSYSAYKDLMIIGTSQVNGAQTNLQFRLNGSTSGYSQITMSGSPSGAGPAYTASLDRIVYWYAGQTGTGTTNYRGLNMLYFTNFGGSQHKTCTITSAFASAGTAELNGIVATTNATWANSGAITGIAIAPNNETYPFVAGATFQLYGIKNA